MSVLITGATGFAGSRLLHHLLTEQSEEPIVLLGRHRPEVLRRRVEAAVSWLGADGLAPRAFSRLRCLQADLTLPGLGLSAQERVEATAGLSTVWHCAALLSLRGDAASLYPANVVGTRRLLELVESAPEAHLIHVSTAYVAGRRTTGRILEGDLSEEAGFQVPYEESKFTAERLVHHWAGADRRRVTIVRPSLLVDDRAIPKGLPAQPLGVLAEFVTAALRERTASGAGALCFRLLGDPQGTLNLLQADYATRAMLRVAAAPGGPGVRTVHITHPQDTPFRTIVAGLELGHPGLAVRIVPELTDPTPLEAHAMDEYGNLLGYSTHRRTYDRSNLLRLVGDLPDPRPVDAAYLARAVAPAPLGPSTPVAGTGVDGAFDGAPELTAR